MSTTKAVAPRVATADTKAALRRQYGCGPVELTGSTDALYERHLLFDNVAEPATVGARERYEAFARAVRAVLSQRWVRTEQTYDRENLKRAYYLSMEFLIGGRLARLLSRLDGHDAVAGHGVRAPLRVRNVPANHRGRLATRTARQLASPPRPVGGRPPRREGRDQGGSRLGRRGRRISTKSMRKASAAPHIWTRS